MRTNILITLFALLLLGPVICSAQQSSSHQKTKITKTSNARKAHKGWKLVWADEFNGKKIDKKSWRRCRRNNADWGRHMHDMESLCEVGDGTLKLWAIKTPTELNLSQPCITGGSRASDYVRFATAGLMCEREWIVPQDFGLQFGLCPTSISPGPKEARSTLWSI